MVFLDMSEILKRFGDDCEFTGEYKYDGERAQIHVNKDGSMNIFRNWFNIRTFRSIKSVRELYLGKIQ